MKNTLPVLLLVSILFVPFHKVNAQGKEVTLDPTQITASILPIMIHLEAKLGEKQSATIGGGLLYSVFLESEIGGESTLTTFSSPFVTASFRNYYNRKRVNKDNLKNNSGNYVGLYTFYQFETPVEVIGIGTVDTDLGAFAIGPVWGIQRNYASGIHLDLSLGLGYYAFESDEFLQVDNTIGFIGGFEFGYRF